MTAPRIGLLYLFAALLLSTACEPEPVTSNIPGTFSVAYDLQGEGSFGRSYGSLRITSDGNKSDICWDLTVEGLPRAVQLHHDVLGPSDPVVAALYEPPGARLAQGCRPVDLEVAVRVREDPDDFYIDGHLSDRAPQPMLWASLVRHSD